MKYPLYVRSELNGFGAYLHDANDKHLGYMGSEQTAEAVVSAVNEVASLREKLATAVDALSRLGSFETFTNEGWVFSHPELTARVDFARKARHDASCQ